MYLCLFFLGSVLGVKQGLLQDAVFIQYDLFGNPVSTDEFRDSARFTQEMATAKIFSNIDTILDFFGWHIEPISFTFHNSVNNRTGSLQPTSGSGLADLTFKPSLGSIETTITVIINIKHRIESIKSCNFLPIMYPFPCVFLFCVVSILTQIMFILVLGGIK